MNETKKAIEHFHYGITHDIFSEPVTTYARLAVEALREQAERVKGATNVNQAATTANMMYDDFANIMASKDVVTCHEPKHKYCPMCGKRLEVEHE